MALQILGNDPSHLKMGVVGLQGSGKTHTAIDVALGVREFFELDGPIGMFDTERGSEYVRGWVKERTGKDLVGRKERTFDGCVGFLDDCMKENASVAVIDNVTHVWRELCDSYLTQMNDVRVKRNKSVLKRLSFPDWNVIKPKWATLTNLFTNSPLHVIVSGREGYEWDWEEHEDGRTSDLTKVGIRMKAEGEFGYEPSLLIRMERYQKEADGKTSHRATVMKCRFKDSGLDGKVINEPEFKHFLPHIERLKPGQHSPVDLDGATDMQVTDDGNVEWQRERRRREIACEEAQSLITRAYPGMSAADKKAKAEIIDRAFGTGSWTKVQSMRAEDLEPIIDALPVIIESYRKEQESAPEKSKPKAKAKAGK